jgi:hypothetical protein
MYVQLLTSAYGAQHKICALLFYIINYSPLHNEPLTPHLLVTFISFSRNLYWRTNNPIVGAQGQTMQFTQI